MIDWAASILTALALGSIVLLLGGPPWAAVGIGYLTFQVLRVGRSSR